MEQALFPYFVVISAVPDKGQREAGATIIPFGNSGILASAPNEAEAKRIGLAEAERIWPKSHGWADYSAAPRLLDRAAAKLILSHYPDLLSDGEPSAEPSA
jgi:hypothetical protein